MAQFQFNAREVEPDQGRAGAIPAGWYKTMVTKTELKPTSSGTGLLIAITAQVVEGQYKGSNFFTNFNVQNDNEKAVEIGRKQLSALCHAVGVLDMTDTEQLKNIPFYTRLKLTPAVVENGQVKYEEKNEPNAYRHVQDQMAIAKATETAAAKPAVAPGAPAARPAAPPMQQQQQQQFTPPPAAQQFQAPPAAVAPIVQHVAAQQFQAPQQQFQAPQQQQQFQPAPAPAGQPDWAAAPAQPWGAAPAQQAQQQQQAPVMSPEQQAAYAASQAAPVPWGAPQ